MKKPIERLFLAAELADARSHDLRRTFASITAESGIADPVIAALLGHATRGVLRRHYVVTPNATLIDAASSVSATIARLLDGD